MAKKKIDSSVLRNFAEDSYRKISNEKLRISFKFVDWESEEFFLHGLTKKYYELTDAVPRRFGKLKKHGQL